MNIFLTTVKPKNRPNFLINKIITANTEELYIELVHRANGWGDYYKVFLKKAT